MKKNLFLLSLCIILTILAYVIEEKGDEKRAEKKERESKIFNMETMGEVLSFQTSRANIKFNGSGAIINSNSRRVDGKRLDLAFKELAKIRVERIIDKDVIKPSNRYFFFPENAPQLTFEFEKGLVKYILGKKVNTSRSFYLEIDKGSEKTQIIAHNPDPLKQAMSEEQLETNDFHYRRFKSIFYLDDNFFEDKHVLNAQEKRLVSNSQEIYFNNKRNRPFRLMVEKNQSVPATPENISINKERIGDYINELHKLESSSPYVEVSNQNELKENMGTVTFVNGQINMELNLFGEFKGKKSRFIKVKNRVYEITTNSSHLFLANSQDFWNKKLELPKKTVGAIKFPKETPIKIAIEDDRQFSVKTLDSKNEVNNREFQRIYNFLKKEAQFVSKATKEDPKGIIQNLFDLEVDKMKLKVMRTKGEVIVHDKNKNVKYHYLAGKDLPFSINKEKIAPIKKQ